MPRRATGHVNPAPIWRRLVAWLINALVTIGGGGSTVMAAWLMPERLTERVSAALPKRPPQLLSSLEPTFAVLARNSRGPGFRAMGLRLADAHTGGPVTVRSALIGHLFSVLTGTLTRELLRPTQTAGLDRMEVLHKQAQEIEHQFPDDSRARIKALTQLYQTGDVRPLSSCGWHFAAGLIPNLPLPGPNRSIRELITGTVVIEGVWQPPHD